MRKLIVAALMLVMPCIVHAEDIKAEATVNNARLSMGEAGQLTLTIHGVKQGIEPPQWPKIDGIETSYLGPSTSISIINGQYSSIHAYNYNIFPSKTGDVTIPALTITVDGKQYTTEPIKITIVDAPKGQAAPSNPDVTDATVSLKDKIFMMVSTPQANVYLGQKVPIRIKLYINQLPIRNLQFPKFEQDGFTAENFPQPPQYNEVVNGVNHTVVDYQGFIYPTRAGELKIGPIRIDGNLLYKNQRSNPMQGSGFFNDDFFSSMFDSYQERPITVNADPLRINVLPLPVQGQPNNFTGAVGQVNFSASISPQEVRTGDPVTLRMQLSGVANYKSLDMPEFNDGRFKTYDPVVKDGDNSRSVEQVIIPTSEAITQVPAIAFNYFDPTSGEYKVITQGPFPLKVLPLSKDQEFKAVGFSDLSKGEAVAPTEQVDYVKQYIITPIQYVVNLMKRGEFWLGVIILIFIMIVALVSKRFQHKLRHDTAFARRHRAFKEARLGLKKAQEYLHADKPKDFYHTLTRTLNVYIADKIHKTSAGLSLEDVLAILKQKGISDTVIHSIKSIYENADIVQYASGDMQAAQMKEDLDKINLVTATLEKKL